MQMYIKRRTGPGAPSSSSSPSGAALPSREAQPAADGGRGCGAGPGAGESRPLVGAAGRPPNRDARCARRATSSASNPPAAPALLRRRPFGGGGGSGPAAAAEPPPLPRNLGMLASAAALAAVRAASSICTQHASTSIWLATVMRREMANQSGNKGVKWMPPTLPTCSASGSLAGGASERPKVN